MLKVAIPVQLLEEALVQGKLSNVRWYSCVFFIVGKKKYNTKSCQFSHLEVQFSGIHCIHNFMQPSPLSVSKLSSPQTETP